MIGGVPNLQNIVRNRIGQLLSWTIPNEREKINREQRSVIEVAQQIGQ